MRCPYPTQRVCSESASRRARASINETPLCEASVESERSEDCGWNCVRSEVSGVLSPERSRHRGQDCRGPQSRGNIQTTHKGDNLPVRWPKHDTGGRATEAVSAGMEVLFSPCRDADNVPKPRLMDTSSPPGGPAQALATRSHRLSWSAKSGRIREIGRHGGRRGMQSLVASKPVLQPQQGSHGVLFRQLGCAPALMTSTTRTARCGPAWCDVKVVAMIVQCRPASACKANPVFPDG